MREILFRGKRMDNGEWAVGYLYEHEPALVGIASENDAPEPSKWFIARTGFADWNMPRPVEFVEVAPSTVGQYTGLKDKNGKRIFDGDVVKVLQGKDKGIAYVGFENGAFMLYPKTGNIYERNLWSYWYNDFDVEVIGNIHDNKLEDFDNGR